MEAPQERPGNQDGDDRQDPPGNRVEDPVVVGVIFPATSSAPAPTSLVMMKTMVGVALAGVLGLLGGCSSGGADGSDGAGAMGKPKPGPTMTVSEGCLQTKCDARKENESHACSLCLDACFSASYSCDSETACDSSCGDSRPCSDWESECKVEGFQITLPNNPSAEVAAACRRMFDHADQCGFQLDVSSYMCDTFAAVEKPSVAAAYDCTANLACDDWANGAGQTSCSLPPSDFGDRFCAALTACPAFCSAQIVEKLNAQGAWLRSDVMDAGIFCATRDNCSDVDTCFQSWGDAVGY